MSKLLFDSQPLIVIPELATLVGLNEAIILQQVNYWTEHNRKAGTNQKEGEFWTYNSYEDWQRQFPFWSVETIKRTITKLEKIGLLISGNFNNLKIDRTKWYRVDYGVLDAFYRGAKISGNGRVKMTCPSGQNDPMGIYDDSAMLRCLKTGKITAH